MSKDEQVISGEKVFLKTPSIEDLDYIQKLWTDPATMKEVGGPVSTTYEQMKKWFERVVAPGTGKNKYFLIIRRKSDEPVGEVSFHHYEEKNGTAMFNIKIDSKYRGKGMGVDAMNSMLKYYFMQWGGKVMLDDLAVDNENAHRLFHKFGFEHIKGGQGYLVRLEKEEFIRLHGQEPGGWK